MNQLVPFTNRAPALVAAAGARASYRFLEFFTANIRNPHTRRAYAAVLLKPIEPLWNAERKDRLEWHMADLVCSGQLDLHVAQEAIRTNWVDAWKEHGAEAIRQVREARPADYLKIVAMIVSKCEDLSLDGEMRDAAVEQFIEERRQKALKMIAKMDEAE